MTKNIIKGFTLAEAMVCLVLIGIIFTSSIGVMNRKIDYTKLYYQAFNTLFQAAKYMAEEKPDCDCENDCDKEETCYKATCWRDNTHNCKGQVKKEYEGLSEDASDRKFPGILFYGENFNNNMIFASLNFGKDEEFCEKLTKNINLAPGIKCKSFISTINPSKTADVKTKGVNFFDAFPATECKTRNEKGACAEYKAIQDEEKGELADITPTFIAANGQRFYISRVVTAYLKSQNKIFNDTQSENFRFIVVDLNGKTKPNSQFKTGDLDPDLVLFAITASGDVIPLGLPEFDKTYINARVYDHDGKKTETKTLWEAKNMAWGPITQFEDAPPYNNPISDLEPLSQSARLYYIAYHCSKNTSKDCGNIERTDNKLYADDLFTGLVMQFVFEKEGETCESEEETDTYTTCNITNFYHKGKDDPCGTIKNRNSLSNCAIGLDHED